MAVYTPNIPLGTDNISASQPQIKDNFNVLNTSFGIDHTAFNVVPAAGQHKQVTIIGPGPGVAPAPLSSVFHSLAATGILNVGKPLAAFANSVDDYNLMPDLQYTQVAGPPIEEIYSFYLGELLSNFGYLTTLLAAFNSKATFQTAYTVLNQILYVNMSFTGQPLPPSPLLNYTITGVTLSIGTGIPAGRLFYLAIGY